MTAVWNYILSDYSVFSWHYPHGMPLCIFMFSPFFFLFSLQAPAPQEGGAKVEVFSNIFFLLPFIILHFLALKSPCFRFIKSGFFCVHCDYSQRARSEPDYKVPLPRLADVRPLETHWSSYANPHEETKRLYLSVLENHFDSERFLQLVTTDHVLWIMLLSNASVQYSIYRATDSPSLFHTWLSMKF